MIKIPLFVIAEFNVEFFIFNSPVFVIEKFIFLFSMNCIPVYNPNFLSKSEYPYL